MYDILTAGDDVYVAFRSRDGMKPAVAVNRDGGRSWREIDLGADVSGTPAVIAAAPSQPDVLYIGGNFSQTRIFNNRRGGFVYKSFDAGETWAMIAETDYGNDVLDIAVDPSDPDRVYLGTEKGLYRSDDGGTSWRDVDGEFCESIAIGNEGTVYASRKNRIVFSRDCGETWHRIVEYRGRGFARFRDQFGRILIDDRSGMLYAASLDGLLKIDLSSGRR